MHIVHIAAEMTPVAKVGGLGDVISGLGRELAARGHRVDIIIPKYDCMESGLVSDLTISLDPLITHYDGRRQSSAVWKGWVEGLKVYFIEAPSALSFFNRGTVYGCPDDVERFLYFSHAALEFLMQKNVQPDLLHLHDWPTAIIPLLVQDIYAQLGVKSKTVYTVHNIEYQGRCSAAQLSHIGLDGKSYARRDSLGGNGNSGELNLMKGGIVYSDFVNTVSPTYAKEVLDPPGGQGLESTLRRHLNKFVGILNGLDYTYWNPEGDRYIERYRTAHPPVSLRGDALQTAATRKATAKAILRERLGLVEEHQPIVCSVTRLVPQKSPHLIHQALTHTLKKGGQFVLLGSSPTPPFDKEFENLRAQYEGHSHVSINLRSSEELAHLIFAGSDITIVPSLFEPCGLTQLIALRYGTIPVVRRTGGLADTIFDVDTSGLPFEKTNGFVFDHPDIKGLTWALDRALACWMEQPTRWQQLMSQAMAMDYSWARSVDAYLDIYNKVMNQNEST